MAKRLLGSVLALLALLAPVVAGPARPLVVIFPTGQARLAPVAAKKETKEAPDQIADTERFAVAARVLRGAFEEEGVVDALIFAPDAPTFRRALQETRISLDPNVEPGELERLRLGAACGASYIVSVTTLLSTETDAKTTMLQMEAVEVRPGKTPTVGTRWKESIQVGGVQTSLASRRGPPIAYQSAARTLVLRFLNGPLRDLHRVTPRPELLPQPPKPATTALVDTITPAAQADQVRLNGEALLRDGNLDEGIRTLKRAVNLAPRAVAPRAALIRAYLGARRNAEASDEATRALQVTDPKDALGRQELNALVAQTLHENGDPVVTRQGYENILRADPANAAVRLALADLLLSQEDYAGAEEHYRILRREKPENKEIAWGLARLLAGKGEFDAAFKELSQDPAARHNFGIMLFLESAMRLANRLIQNRAAWQEEKLTREAFYTATTAQATKAATFTGLLNATSPPTGSSALVIQAHKHRLLAASLLSQSIANLLQYLETGETPSAAQAKVLLDDFFVEIKDAGTPTETKP